MKTDVVVPIASVLVIYLARLVELRTKRNTIPGPVKENLTLRLFVLAGFLMLAASITEFLLRRSSLYWPTFAAGWFVRFVLFCHPSAGNRRLGQILEPARGNSGQPSIRPLWSISLGQASDVFFDDS